MFQHTAARRRLQPIVAAIRTGGYVSTHSRAKAAADYLNAKGYAITWFQHTAARRRLQCKLKIVLFCCLVSTHSRAKAAAIEKILLKSITYGFNTQPREGGCHFRATTWLNFDKFQHTAARRRLLRLGLFYVFLDVVSTHSRAKAAAFSVKYR